jgi:DNA-binding SARP family transcriptional activator
MRGVRTERGQGTCDLALQLAVEENVVFREDHRAISNRRAPGAMRPAGFDHEASRAAAVGSESELLPVDAGSCFRIYMLGPAWIEWGGEPLTVCRRQARALLYRLAAHPQPVPREELCFAFWPDTSETVAHRHLSHVLCHLRECLPICELLRSSNEMVELDPNKVWSDVRVFRAVCGMSDADSLDTMEQALELYRGPFLSGFSLPDAPEFELWVTQQRRVFERTYLDALATLIAVEASQSEFARAIRHARQYLRIDELAESVHRQLMVLYATLGDRPAALQQYQDCAASLERRLGVKPLPETRAVYQAILQS